MKLFTAIALFLLAMSSWVYGDDLANPVYPADVPVVSGGRFPSVAVNGNGDFFIVYGESGINTTSVPLGWLYNGVGSATPIFPTTSPVSNAKTFLSVANSSGFFFITNEATHLNTSTNPLGWFYTGGVSATPVFPTAIPPVAASSLSIAVNHSDLFFLSNNASSINITTNPIGWIFNGSGSATPIFPTEIPASSAKPSSVVADSSGNFFIINESISINTSTNPVGWFYNGTTATPIFPSSLPGNSFPFSVAVDSSGFFISNNVSGVNNTTIPIGWFYSGGATAFPVFPSSVPSASANPNYVVSNDSGDFFIVNASNDIDTSTNPVGWVYNGSGDATPVFPSTIPSSAAFPIEIGVNNKGDFLISIYGLSYGDEANPIAWFYDGGSSATPVFPVTSPAASAYPYYVAADGNGDFFIVNSSSSIDQNSNPIGWLYNSGLAVAVYPSMLPSSMATPYALVGNATDQFFIINQSNHINVVDNPVGWNYTVLGSTVRAFRRPSNRR